MSNTIPLPEPIGEIVGVRLTPKDTREFWGYFAKGFEGMEKVRVHTADQMHAHAAAVTAAKDARIKVLEDALKKIAKSSPHEDGCYYTNRGNIIAARAALGDSAPTPQPPSPSPRS